MPVTIHDIAKLTGKSYPTVSRALNNHPKISVKTRDQIKAAAKLLGYRPSFAGTSLQCGKTKTINVIIPNLRNPFYAKMIDEAQRHCRLYGYAININVYNFDPKMEYQYFDRVLNRTCDGVICQPTSFRHTGELFNQMWEFNIPCVSIGVPQGAENVNVDMVDIDFSPSRVAYLASLGHRNIVYAISGHDKFQIDICSQGFQKEMAAAGLPFSPEKNLCAIYGYSHDLADCGYCCGQKLFKEYPQATAVVAVNDAVACGIIRAAVEAGIDIPGDVSIIGQDNIWPGLYTPVQLSTYDLNLEDAVKKCFELMFDSPRPRSPIVTKVKGSLVIRASTGPVKSDKFNKCP